MTGLIDTMPHPGGDASRAQATAEAPDEWLVPNGLGGYASASVSGTMTRRYHGFLIAALPSPLGRMVVLNDLDVAVERADGTIAALRDHGRFEEFSLDLGLPRWRHAIDGLIVETSIVIPARHNIVHVNFRLVGANTAARLRIRPLIDFRPLDADASEPPNADFRLTAHGGSRYEIASHPDLPTVRMEIWGGKNPTFMLDGGTRRDCFYLVEAERGYESHSTLWSPGAFSAEIGEDTLTLVAATEPWRTLEALTPANVSDFEHDRRRRLIRIAAAPARQGLGPALVLAADAFVITPVGRTADAARAHAQGDEVRTVIAGYHWFTDWGRDTMISLEGLTLATGRAIEARWILRTFAHFIRDGLIPNLFPEGKTEGLYHTADGTLWFFHALHRYVETSGDRDTLRLLLPALKDIVQHHLKGTRFGIHVDPADGLLAQGAEDYQLTWMDAKVGDWVVTPRRGKAVEINALWYNALCLLKTWLEQEHDADAVAIAAHAQKTREAFNRRFWYEAGNYLYDVVDGPDGDDKAFRPNQIFAVSLDHPVLDPARWPVVVSAVRERLLTPVGLRSLDPGSPDFKPHYFGDVRSRDAAYHQGTVWAWLIGPFIDAWLRVHPDDRRQARTFLDGFRPHLLTAGRGFISEIFDAEPPYTPRGCMAQAWSVAEVLRSLIKVVE